MCVKTSGIVLGMTKYEGQGSTAELTFLQMVKPSPVPPNRRAVLESAWLKGLNSLLRTSSSMPIPVSSMVNRTSIDSSFSLLATTDSLTAPTEVNLMLFVSRFVRICRILKGRGQPARIMS